jgi:hypothetical protein
VIELGNGQKNLKLYLCILLDSCYYGVSIRGYLKSKNKGKKSHA